ncbi:MAG: hypothetical protein ACT4OU_01320 [Hyphomicrobium sp.]
MKYWIGASLGVCGAYLFMVAQAHRARVRAARTEAVRDGRPAERPVAADSVAALGEMVAPVVLVALGWFTLKLCFAYYILQPVAYFTLFDLAGTLALVGGYASWLLAKTHYRMPPELNVSKVMEDDAVAPNVVLTVKPRTRTPQRKPAVQDFPYPPTVAAKAPQVGLSME